MERTNPYEYDEVLSDDIETTADDTDKTLTQLTEDGNENTYRMSEFQILKNVAVVSVAFMCLFSSFQALQNLQSSLNKEDGLGTGGLAIIYGALLISCLVLPVYFIAHLGCKWTISLATICYIVYMAANFHAVWGLLAPASAILGLGAAPLWAAKCTYLTQLAVWYAKLKGITEDDAINRFFGFFFMAFQSAQIWGNLISSLVFKRPSVNETEVTYDSLETCGAAYFPATSGNNTNLDRPEMSQIYTLLGIYLSCAILAFLLVAIFLDNVTLDGTKTKKSGKRISAKLLIETVQHWWRSTSQKLLVPLTIYSGIQQVFMAADFTKSYISCTLGIDHVGYVMICYGVTDAICSLVFGRLVQFLGHIPFFVLAFLLQGGCQIGLLVWQPDPEDITPFYVFASAWGMADAVIQTQLNSLYGYLFTSNKEAAFSNYRLWESMGFLLAFAYSNYLYTSTKLYIAMVCLVTGMAGYTAVEVLERRQTRASAG